MPPCRSRKRRPKSRGSHLTLFPMIPRNLRCNKRRPSITIEFYEPYGDENVDKRATPRREERDNSLNWLILTAFKNASLRWPLRTFLDLSALTPKRTIRRRQTRKPDKKKTDFIRQNIYWLKNL